MKNELYEQLRTKCYEIIYPDGVPLEEGVDIIYSQKPGVISKHKIISTKEHAGLFYVKPDYNFLTPKKLSKTWIVKILGKELELRDILHCFSQGNQGPFALDEDGVLLEYEGFEDGYCPKNIRLDLTKPISEQDEEVGQNLLKLIS